MGKFIFAKLAAVFSNRIFILFCGVCLFYILLLQRLFTLQIVLGEQYAASAPVTASRVVVTDAVRGNVYDRYGRPLAVNQTVYAVYYDPGMKTDDLNHVINRFLSVLERNAVAYVDDFPMTREAPYSFTFPSEARERQWKKDMGFSGEQMDFNAQEAFTYLTDFFKVEYNLPDERIRDIISIRSAIYLQRYNQHHLICVAEGLPNEAVAELEEQYERYPGFSVQAGTIRYYPYGGYASHIVGYIHTMNEDEWAYYQNYGYAYTDKVGKSGIEKSFELALSGEKGWKVLEVTPLGRVARQIEESPAQKGQDVFLTLDMNLQIASADILEQNLQEAIVKKYQSGQYNARQLFASMVESNYISIAKMMQSTDMPVQNRLRDIIVEEMQYFDMQSLYDIDSEEIKQAKQIVRKAIESRQLSLADCLFLLEEQGKIQLTEEERNRLQKGQLQPADVLVEKIQNGVIPVHAFNLDPCTGAIVVMDVNTGDVLALVSYPSYDNNRLVNSFDYEYYLTLLHDPATPLINRPLMQRKAPGSTLKMLSAITALEEGLITPSTVIQDHGVFTKAGLPYAKCLIYSRTGGTHGAVSVSKAIEVSCNYFFYEIAYRLGDNKEENTSIEIFNRYMAAFGLDAVSGIEIEEYPPQMATPELKQKLLDEPWRDGDTIRSAIGQSVNNYAAIHMAKYISTLANGGSRFQASIVYGFKENSPAPLERREIVLEEQLYLKNENLQAVYDGMLRVTSGAQGTLRHVFAGFPVAVGGKSGTAEESSVRPAHAWFTGYAPFEQPQIAVVVLIPFGEDAGIESKIAKEIIAAYLLGNESRDKKILSYTLTK